MHMRNLFVKQLQEEVILLIISEIVVQLFNAIKSTQKVEVKKSNIPHINVPIWMDSNQNTKPVEESWDALMEENAPL